MTRSKDPRSGLKLRCVTGCAAVALLCALPARADLLTDSRYAVGAKSRLAQFIRRGANPKDAEAIFRRLNDLEPTRWVQEWTRLAEPIEAHAAELEAQGRTAEARDGYLKASAYYSIAKFPVIDHPAKQAAYRKCIDTYRKAAKYFDPPMEIVRIPFEGKQITGYFRRPPGVVKPALVITTGGIDVYKEDRDVSDILGAGMAAFSMDMPGAGENPVWYTADADRVYTATIDYLVTRPDIDPNRLAIIGRSYGGYWGAKMAYVEPRRLKAAVDWGGPTHYTFQEPWLRGLKQDKLYLWSILDAFVYAHHVKNYDELLAQAPTLSLESQGWLNKPAAPLLAVNGAKDPWMTIQDVYVLFEGGEPKSARVYPEGGHMGGDPGSGPMIVNWIKSRFGMTGGS